MSIASVILPNQLFENNLLLINLSKYIYVVEEPTFFTKYPFHQMKLILHRASMKYYYDYLNDLKTKNESFADKKIIYVDLDKFSWTKICAKHKILHMYDPIDNPLKTLLESFEKKYATTVVFYSNPLFLESDSDLDTYYNSLKSHTNYIHDNGFYKWQRQRLNILLDDDQNPLFGKLSFDHDNRKPFNSSYTEPAMPVINQNEYIEEAKLYVKKRWSDNFGSTEDFIYPTTHSEAKALFNKFLKHKLSTFGIYEDAVSTDIPFGSHSLLSSSINIGLITIDYILKKVLKIFDSWTQSIQKKMIPNVEGFIRQLIGWRSYVRFIYKYHGTDMLTENNLNHQNKLSESWYNASTQIYPIDELIKKVHKYAYAHHIERLMYLGNFALLCQIKPIDTYDWFMICFIDSYEWVMVPNVMGMSQFASSSIRMMTRPYFSSSNYIKNMSNYKLNTFDTIILDNQEYYWNEIWDALYYNFIYKHKNILKSIYAVARNVAHWNKKTPSEQKKLIKLAKLYLKN